MIKCCKNEIADCPREHFQLDLKNGLTSEQVLERKEAGLVNKTKKHVSKSYARIIYDNLVNVTNILLYVTAIFMIIAGIKWTRYMFLIILVSNITIGLIEDIRARKLLDKLKVVSSISVGVLRDGEIKQVDGNELVYSDIVSIKQGNQLVCDGEIVEGFVEMNESLLTGESRNISKQKGDRVYSGSFVASGRALYRVDHLGKENYAETLQSNAKQFKRVKSEILKTIRGFFRVIVVVIFILILVQVILNLSSFKDFTSGAFKNTIDHLSASIIAMTPIGMYLLTSLTLAVGVINLAKKKMLAQDMYCIESLARVDTLCLDKTGTITDGQLNVMNVVSKSKLKENDIKQILRTLVEATKDENSTSRAIKEEFSKLEVLPFHSGVPFSSERKYSAVSLSDGRSFVLGAREFIPHKDKEIDEMCQVYEKKGLRVLVIAEYKHVLKSDEQLKNTKLIGFIVLQDHIRDDAPANIKWFKENGVDIRIITGDNPESAAEIARRAGVDGADKFISLDGMSIEEVKNIANDYIIFGRVTPEQKAAIIESLKEHGRTVAMTGDGVNDILALRVADCSIAMASGADAAKNVAHLVSMDSSFSALPDVVKEGRRVINNLQRSISLFLVKTGFAMVITTLVIAQVFSKLTNEYLFTTNNMYLWEVVTIGIGSLFLSLQPNDEQIKSKFLLNIVFRVIPAALVQIGAVFFLYMFYDKLEIANYLSVLAISFLSFLVFIRVCLKFDIYRLVLVIAMAIITAGILLGDFLLGTQILEIDYKVLQVEHWLALLLVILVASAVYVGLSFAASKLHNYIDKKREEKKNESFGRSKESIGE